MPQFYRLAYEASGPVLVHEEAEIRYTEAVPAFPTMVESILGAIRRQDSEVSLYFGRMKATKLMFLPPTSIAEVYNNGRLLSTNLVLFGRDPKVEQLATQLFETKVRMVAPGVFDRPDALKLLRLTRLPLCASVRQAHTTDIWAEIADVAEEMLLLAFNAHDAPR